MEPFTFGMEKSSIREPFGILALKKPNGWRNNEFEQPVTYTDVSLLIIKNIRKKIHLTRTFNVTDLNQYGLKYIFRFLLF